MISNHVWRDFNWGGAENTILVRDLTQIRRMLGGFRQLVISNQKLMLNMIHFMRSTFKTWIHMKLKWNTALYMSMARVEIIEKRNWAVDLRTGSKNKDQEERRQHWVLVLKDSQKYVAIRTLRLEHMMIGIAHLLVMMMMTRDLVIPNVAGTLFSLKEFN